MKSQIPYWTAEEQELANQFLEQGYVILPVEDINTLNKIRNKITEAASAFLNLGFPSDPDYFLNNIHQHVSPEELNQLRLAVITEMTATNWLRPAYFSLARQALNNLVGNELAMQLRINLSVQMPQDNSSTLPVHADVWSGDSPYEIVAWLPYVDVSKSQSMFIVPRAADQLLQQNFKEISGKSAEDLFRAIEPHAKWLDIPYGHILLFNQNQMHGNIINTESTTRWSSNCRFKSIFSPYHDKKLGEFFEPIVIRPLTIIGAGYTSPDLGNSHDE